MNWEYWPMSITIIPVVCFYLWQSLRSRSMAFFTAVNPSIYMGGLYGTPKSEINRLIPPQYLPLSLIVTDEQKDPARVMEQFESLGLQFPIIVKPNVGERGLNVQKVLTQKELEIALRRTEGDVMLQEYIDYPLEITVLCYVFPDTEEAAITSVCTKEFLTVTGDGKSMIEQLMRNKPRAVLQLKRLSATLDMTYVPSKGEVVLLEPIGNHNRGTRFVNANHLIDKALEGVFIPIVKDMPGICFGRFDLRANSVEELKQGKKFKVLEFNGVNAEPVHVYDPDYPVWKGYRDFWRQWRVLRRIAVRQRQLGVEFRPVGESWRAFRAYLAYKKRATRHW